MTLIVKAILVLFASTYLASGALAQGVLRVGDETKPADTNLLVIAQVLGNGKAKTKARFVYNPIVLNYVLDRQYKKGERRFYRGGSKVL